MKKYIPLIFLAYFSLVHANAASSLNDVEGTSYSSISYAPQVISDSGEPISYELSISFPLRNDEAISLKIGDKLTILANNPHHYHNGNNTSDRNDLFTPPNSISYMLADDKYGFGFNQHFLQEERDLNQSGNPLSFHFTAHKKGKIYINFSSPDAGIIGSVIVTITE